MPPEVVLRFKCINYASPIASTWNFKLGAALSASLVCASSPLSRTSTHAMVLFVSRLVKHHAEFLLRRGARDPARLVAVSFHTGMASSRTRLRTYRKGYRGIFEGGFVRTVRKSTNNMYTNNSLLTRASRNEFPSQTLVTYRRE